MDYLFCSNEFTQGGVGAGGGAIEEAGVGAGAILSPDLHQDGVPLSQRRSGRNAGKTFRFNEDGEDENEEEEEGEEEVSFLSFHFFMLRQQKRAAYRVSFVCSDAGFVL